MPKFKPGDQIRYSDSTDPGLVVSIVGEGWYRIFFEADNEENSWPVSFIDDRYEIDPITLLKNEFNYELKDLIDGE